MKVVLEKVVETGDLLSQVISGQFLEKEFLDRLEKVDHENSILLGVVLHYVRTVRAMNDANAAKKVTKKVE